jgi:hypothetical protein
MSLEHEWLTHLEHDWTPFSVAACHARKKHLLNGTGSLSPDLFYTRTGFSGLALAVLRQWKDGVEWLLAHGIPLSHAHTFSTPCLPLSAWHDVLLHWSDSELAWWIDQGQDLQAVVCTYTGDTPLHIACRANRLSCARLLVNRGASLTARNQAGLCPWQLLRAVSPTHPLAERVRLEHAVFLPPVEAVLPPE